ncbi:AmmeMemoRadiSam system radical SAM enzyme [Aminivibrio sp.]|uniref:AmmeMemoRadiSam system radical SAM enzyme n=1 Tax=Aminivibrio sp. TaxID=1872489 RepID=UPI001A5763C8|nr:AmmeMemoRadiSam system radical SAM enzyme [Aminivibrio sp.]MBL3538941.1 AmmeMemoRadiSam system radical SAM enzyme [Aminivibrio sp.]
MTNGSHEAPLWRREQERIRCLLCPHCCLLAPGETGKCRARRHEKEKGIVSLNYGKISSAAVDPIEKKPLYHWNPGTSILSLGTVGCSMDCPFCQNWRIAGWDPSLSLASMAPEDVVRSAAKTESKAVAFTYNEPLVWFEFLLDASRALREEGVSTVLVSNGMILPEPLERLLPFVSAANIDLKAFTPEAYHFLGGNLEAVKNTIRTLIAGGVHVEVTFLLVPGINDDRDAFSRMVDWLASLDPQPVLHVSRYFPARKWTAPPPSKEMVGAFCDLARKRLPWVYPGNTGERSETRCLSCGGLLLARREYSILANNLDPQGRCKACGTRSQIIITE